MSLVDDLQATLFKPSRSFGGIVAQCVIEEHHTDEMEITSHPVELGANISDHAFLRPQELTVRMAWNASGVQGLISNFQSISTGSLGDPLQQFYNQLLDLQATRQPFAIVTAKRAYQNMLISSLSTMTDQSTANILMITARCRQVIIVQTMVTNIPPRDVQANPALTAPVINVGQQSLGPAKGFNTAAYTTAIAQ